jgi:hypothetical protein
MSIVGAQQSRPGGGSNSLNLQALFEKPLQDSEKSFGKPSDTFRPDPQSPSLEIRSYKVRQSSVVSEITLDFDTQKKVVTQVTVDLKQKPTSWETALRSLGIATDGAKAVREQVVKDAEGNTVMGWTVTSGKKAQYILVMPDEKMVMIVLAE